MTAVLCLHPQARVFCHNLQNMHVAMTHARSAKLSNKLLQELFSMLHLWLPTVAVATCLENCISKGKIQYTARVLETFISVQYWRQVHLANWSLNHLCDPRQLTCLCWILETTWPGKQNACSKSMLELASSKSWPMMVVDWKEALFFFSIQWGYCRGTSSLLRMAGIPDNQRRH
jgi:hypothetical protein